jgi:predicted RNA-binding Zn-ribbon protein involved in translation (DUF1610 family)
MSGDHNEHQKDKSYLDFECPRCGHCCQQEHMSRKAMQQALEALEILTDGYDGNEVGVEIDAMTALRQALETKQESVRLQCTTCGTVYADGLPPQVAQPEQEPVAWANSFDLQNFDMKVRTGPDLHHTVPLYTAPPKKQWVGLTDEEIAELHHEIKVRLMGTYKTEDIYRAIEKRLKEKNT